VSTYKQTAQELVKKHNGDPEKALCAALALFNQAQTKENKENMVENFGPKSKGNNPYKKGRTDGGFNDEENFNEGYKGGIKLRDQNGGWNNGKSNHRMNNEGAQRHYTNYNGFYNEE
jgi:hypothetical protein